MDTLIDTLLGRFIDMVCEWLPTAAWRRRAFAALVLWFAALFLVVVPGKLLGAGALTPSAVLVKAIAGWTLLTVTAGLVGVAVWQTGRRAVATYRHQMEVRHRHERLHRLSDDEKRVLCHFTRSRTGRFRPDDAVVRGLQGKRILYIPQNICCLEYDFWTFHIQPWAREYLQAHPDLVHDSRDAPA